MTDPDRRDSAAQADLARRFQEVRPRLVAVAYGLLGGVDEAEDAVQETWLRMARAGGERIDDVLAWSVVAVSRIALDMLRSARRRREQYVGEWLPEPVVTDADPAERVTLDESMSLAMLVVLESLSPSERTAFVLHDVFGLSFAEVAHAVGRNPAACRQLAARARRRVSERAPRFDVDVAEHRRVVEAFVSVLDGEDLDALLVLLDPEVVLRTDGGGLVQAARRPVHGQDRVARFLVGLGHRFGGGGGLRPSVVNGWPGLIHLYDGEVVGVVGLVVADGRITEIDVVRNPEKLRRVT